MHSDARAEFDDFAQAAWPKLKRSAHLLTGDAHLAEDLAQAALVRTYTSWKRVRRGDALAFTRKVLVNLNIDRHRRRRPIEVELVDEPARTGRAGRAADAGTGGVDDRDEIVRALAGLTDRERQVIVLRHYFDLPEAEVADELGIALGTVKSTASRALAKLRAPSATQAGAR